MVSIDYRGERYVLGRTADAYAIWDSASGGSPFQVFSGSPEGWAEAWARFGELEGPDAGRMERRPDTDLQPMRAGQIVGQAFRIWWRNLRSLVAISGALLVPVYVVLIPLTILNVELVRVPGAGFRTLRVDPWVQLLDNGVRYLVVAPLLTAAMFAAVALILLGRRPSVGTAYRAARGRWPSILWVILLTTLVIVAPFLSVIPFLVLMAATGEATFAVVLAAVVAVAAAVVAAFLALRFLFSTQVLLLEGRKGVAALRRSWRLVQGLTPKVLGTTLLMGLALFGVFLVFGLISGLLFLPTLLNSTPNEGFLMTFFAVTAILSALVQIVVMPLTSLSTVLLYVDARIRKEGFDRADLEAGVEQLLA